jgi:hypothetical protein
MKFYETRLAKNFLMWMPLLISAKKQASNDCANFIFIQQKLMLR